MPVVPFTQGTPTDSGQSPAIESSAALSPAHLLMAAASMHAMGKLGSGAPTKGLPRGKEQGKTPAR